MMEDPSKSGDSIDRVDSAAVSVNNNVNGDATTADKSLESHDTNVKVEGVATDSVPPETNGLPHPIVSKKRKLDDLESRSRSTSRASSPPWKSFSANGPTQFTEDGKRRSGRVNHIPLDLQPPSDKRTTRKAHESAVLSKQHPARPLHTSKRSSNIGSAAVTPQGKAEPNDVTPQRLPLGRPFKARQTPSAVSPEDSKPIRISSRVKTTAKHFDDMISPPADTEMIDAPKRKPGRPPKLKREQSASSPDARRKRRESAIEIDAPKREHERSPRLRLKMSRAHNFPRHPGFIPRPSAFGSLIEVLETYDAKEKEQGPGDKEDGDLLELRTGPRPQQSAEEMIDHEARSRMRILDATKPGGPLSRERCSLYFADTQEEPAKQYSHTDHLWSHGAYFRTLLHRERSRHMEMAKKTAYACLAKWKEKQPLSEEELQRQEIEWYKLMYKQTVKDIQRKWELITSEIERRRLATYMEQQDMNRDLKMQQLLEDTTEMLNRRRVAFEDSDSASVSGGSGASDDDDDDARSADARSGSSGDDEDSEDDDNMSSSESEGDAEEDVAGDLDEQLSPEALRAKYANLPDVEIEDGAEADEDVDMDAESEVASGSERSATPADMSHVQLDEVDDALMDDEDESTDMSDDMGSSEEESEEEASDDGEEDAGLMGFFGKSQRRNMQKSPTIDAVGGDVEDVQDTDLDDQPPQTANGPEGDHSSQPTPMDDSTAAHTEAESTTTIDAEEIAKIMPTPEETQNARKITTKVPSLLRGTLREYQHYGLDWLAKLYLNQTNGILADEMGLGKTIQTIALLAHLAEEHQVWGPHLIVVPTSVILNWEMEFKKFLPGFKVLSYYGSQEERQQKRKGWSNPDNYNVVITSYQLILKDLGSIRVPEWHYMILDEAHNIKNFQSQRYQAMIRLKTHARLLLTGTPLQNSIQELWSLLTFLTAGQDGQGMGDLDEFTQWFKRPVDEIFVDGRNKLGIEAQEIVNKLHHSLRPYILRRMKSQVEKQLPAKFEHTVFCRLSKRQRQLYDAFLSRADVKEKLSSGNPISVSQALMALRKVCNHPDLFEERPIVTSFTVRKPYSRMPRSVVADYEIKDLLVRRRLLTTSSEEDHKDFAIGFFDLRRREMLCRQNATRGARLSAAKQLNSWMVHMSGQRSPHAGVVGTSLKDTLAYASNQAMTERVERLKTYIRISERRAGLSPIYGHDLVQRCTIRLRGGLPIRRSLELLPDVQPPTLSLPDAPLPAPAVAAPPAVQPIDSATSPWLQYSDLEHASALTPSIEAVGANMQVKIEKFGFVTPHAVAQDVLQYTLPEPARSAILELGQTAEEDPFHEARIRLSVAFPDKRLLQYDCGKLQRLAVLLRELTDRGSRALIFTQMTSVLDILERFLNIHGYKYMRLDGSTRIEQRQDMMERFNRDDRIDVFILSSRSGGVGMNLTGADSVIFYDLDWNPQMDKQCQDRAHRIGQTRDVHIYKLVSEHTIEVNILKKSNQKRMLDEVVIQEGQFTTDRFDKVEEQADGYEAHDAAGAAVDRVLGLGRKDDVEKVLAAAEERVDVEAGRAQQKEVNMDDADFDYEKHGNKPSVLGASTPSLIPGESTTEQDGAGTDVDMNEVPHVDEYMLRLVQRAYDGVAFVPPLERHKTRLDRNGRDRSGHRPRR